MNSDIHSIADIAAFARAFSGEGVVYCIATLRSPSAGILDVPVMEPVYALAVVSLPESLTLKPRTSSKIHSPTPGAQHSSIPAARLLSPWHVAHAHLIGMAKLLTVHAWVNEGGALSP